MSKWWKLGTKLAIWISTAGLIVWDIVVAANRESGDTISEIMLAWSSDLWTIPIAWGVLTGHLMWPDAKPPLPLWARLTGLIGTGVLGILADILQETAVIPDYNVIPIIPVLAGIVLGHFFWPQGNAPQGLRLFTKRG